MGRPGIFYNICVLESQEVTSLVPRFSPSFRPCEKLCAKKLKERESLVWNHAHPWHSWPWLGNNSMESGYGWAHFHTRLSISFSFFVHNNINGLEVTTHEPNNNFESLEGHTYSPYLSWPSWNVSKQKEVGMVTFRWWLSNSHVLTGIVSLY